MKWIKRLFIILFSLFLLLLIVSLFLPSKVLIERSTLIQAPVENIFAQVANLKNGDRWQVWNQLDPNWKVQYSGPNEGVNSSYSWESTNSKVGTGKGTIVAAAPFDSVVIKLEFSGSDKAAFAKTFFKKEGTGIRVTTSMMMDMSGFPLFRYFGLLIRGELEKNFDTGLANLKTVCESGPKDAAQGKYDTYFSWQNEQPYYSITDTVLMRDDLAKIYGEKYGQIGVAIATDGLQMAGPVFAIYHAQDSVRMIVEWAVPVDKAGPGSGDVKCNTFKASKTIHADYYGAYEKASAAYRSIEKFAAEKNVKLKGEYREIYITAATGPDMTNILTVVCRDVE